MLDRREMTAYADGVAAALRIIGPTPRTEALDMLLRTLNLPRKHAAAVLAFALDTGMLVADGNTIRAGRVDTSDENPPGTGHAA